MEVKIVDVTFWAIALAGTAIVAMFNYMLNRASGSDPDDFKVGPSELDITCDCFLNPLIIAGIAVLVLALSSGSFADRFELFMLGFLVFFTISLAGIIGRRRRYREWHELRDLFDRAIPTSKIRRPLDNLPDLSFDVEDDDEDY